MHLQHRHVVALTHDRDRAGERAAFDAEGASVEDPAAERRLVGSFVAGETVGLDVMGSCARIYDLATGKTTKLIDVGPGLRSMTVADVAAVPGNELVTLNAGTVKFWDGPSGAKLMSFPVGHEMVSVAAGHGSTPVQ